MSTSTFESAIADLTNLCSTARADGYSLVTDLDEGRLPTVMGPGAIDPARMSPIDLSNLIKADQDLAACLQADVIVPSDVHKAIRAIVDRVADRTATGTLKVAQDELKVHFLRPAVVKAARLSTRIETIKDAVEQIRDLALRSSGSSANDSQGKINKLKYEADSAVVEKAVAKLSSFDIRIRAEAVKIDTLMHDVDTPLDVSSLTTLQSARSALEKESEYTQKKVYDYFEAGSKAVGAGAKQSLTDLVIPKDLHKGKGKELVQNVRAFLQMRAPYYYVVMPQLCYTMSNALVGLQAVPPTKEDGYVAVKDSLRELYAAQSLRLWEELERKVGKEAIANIRKEFKYGIEEKKAKCEVGDGVTAVFCLLALYRPSGLAYREKIKDQLAASVGKFSDGSCPGVQVKEIWPLIQEALDLGVNIQWSRVGKPIVTALTERNNIFAGALADFAKVNNIVDMEDSAVEISRMFAAVQQACADLEEAGISTKHASNVNWADRGGKGDRGQSECWYGADCHRENCSFLHPGGKKEGKGGKGKGGKGAGKGKGKGAGKGKGKGGKAEFESKERNLCKAEGCQSSGRGFPFCTTCRRKLVEKGEIKRKDGETEKYTAKDSNKRASLAVRDDEAGASNNGEDSELFQFGPEHTMVNVVTRNENGKRAAAVELVHTAKKVCVVGLEAPSNRLANH